MTKYHRTLLVVEVLGNEPYDGDLQDLSAAITEGHFSGAVLMEDSFEVTKEQMAQLLEMQGSSPEFLIPEDEDDDDLGE